MIDYSSLYEAISDTSIANWQDTLPRQVEDALHPGKNRLISEWKEILEALPAVSPSSYELRNGVVRVGEASDLGQYNKDEIEQQLKRLHPWRKGPFDIFGVSIDTEWRSDLKWDRLKDHIAPLDGRLVLDVGCGNGYHCWRMLGEGAGLVVGIDPMPLYVAQYGVVSKYLTHESAYVLPLKIEDVPTTLTGFDSVFSMGVLYHRRSPIDHLMQIKSLLRKGGEMVLETLVVDGDEGYALLPEGRYAKMRNVWFIPSPATLLHWVKRCGFKEIQLIDVTRTTEEEQRATAWMQFESLANFLDPSDPLKTIEGYPAPERAIILAKS